MNLLDQVKFCASNKRESEQFKTEHTSWKTMTQQTGSWKESLEEDLQISTRSYWAPYFTVMGWLVAFYFVYSHWKDNVESKS